jgi:hypothetical protein
LHEDLRHGNFALSTELAHGVSDMALYLDTTIQAAKVSIHAAPRTCIKSEAFDITLLILPLATGLGAVAAVLANPALFTVLLVADLWLLGYHHVVATYTRLAFTKETLRRNRFLAIDLLLLMTAATLALAFTAGAWVVATAFLYLQWFHYMRQGYGLARMYFRTTPDGLVAGSRDLMTDLVIYLVPIYGIAARSATMGDTFLDLPVKTVGLPQEVITALAFAAAAAGLVWLVRSSISFARGTLDTLYAGFVLSHVAIFLVAYIAIEDADTGWLAINVWHNLQYVAVVWMMNQKKYAGGIDPAAQFLSRISQPGRIAIYFASCLGISTLVYVVLGSFVAIVGGGLAITVGIYMGINFHHYVIDALIWKRRRAITQSI